MRRVHSSYHSHCAGCLNCRGCQPDPARLHGARAALRSGGLHCEKRSAHVDASFGKVPESWRPRVPRQSTFAREFAAWPATRPDGRGTIETRTGKEKASA